MAFSDNVDLDTADLDNAGGQLKVAVDAADCFVEVALEVAVVHSGNLYGSDSFDVDGSAAVDGGSDVDVDHTPSPDLQDVPWSDDVI